MTAMTKTVLVFLLVLVLAISVFLFAPQPVESAANSDPVTFGSASSFADFSFDKSTMSVWKMPDELFEISGLALDASAQYAFAHNDEVAVVYRIELATGVVVPWLQLGDPAMEADIEGIARDGEDLYLIDSTGNLATIEFGAVREGVVNNFKLESTGLAEICEVEGLDVFPGGDSLIIVCKDMLAKKADYWDVYRYTPGSENAERLFRIEREQLGDKVHPSGIVAAFGGYGVIAARERLLMHFDGDGELISSTRLAKKRHKQVEGIAITPDTRQLVLADEGGRLSIYRCVEPTCSGQ